MLDFDGVEKINRNQIGLLIMYLLETVRPVAMGMVNVQEPDAGVTLAILG